MSKVLAWAILLFVQVDYDAEVCVGVTTFRL